MKSISSLNKQKKNPNIFFKFMSNNNNLRHYCDSYGLNNSKRSQDVRESFPVAAAVWILISMQRCTEKAKHFAIKQDQN